MTHFKIKKTLYFLAFSVLEKIVFIYFERDRKRESRSGEGREKQASH